MLRQRRKAVNFKMRIEIDQLFRETVEKINAKANRPVAMIELIEALIEEAGTIRSTEELIRLLKLRNK